MANNNDMDFITRTLSDLAASGAPEVDRRHSDRARTEQEREFAKPPASEDDA